MPLAVLGALVAMELQQVQRHRIENLAQFAAAGVDEQADAGHERRQGTNDFPRPMNIHRPRALRIEHQADGIGARRGGGQGVLDSGDTADLDANGWQRRRILGE